jgi:hypothetical protein
VGFASEQIRSPDLRESAEPIARSALVEPLEYSRVMHAGEVRQLEAGPPLEFDYGRAYSVPPSQADVVTEPKLSRDYWGQSESVFAAHRRGHPTFSWRERDWNLAHWRRRLRGTPALVAATAILVASLVLGLAVAGRVARGLQLQLPAAQATPASRDVVIQMPEQTTPTPTDAPVDIGAWVSNPTPGTSGSVQVFVRVTAGLQPVAHVPVTIDVQSGGSGGVLGPVSTNAYGLATFTLNYSSPPQQPVFITASATVDGRSYSFDTSFVPQ